MKVFYKSAILIAILILTSYLTSTASELTEKIKKQTITTLNKMLEEEYVFPDVAIRCAEHLQMLFAQGKYSEVEENEDFAKQLTEDLQYISNDKHMRVRIRKVEEVRRQSENPLLDDYIVRRREAERNHGFLELKILEGNIGYLDLRQFASPYEARETAVNAMKFLSNSDAIIFDLRKNGGGSPAMVQLLCSYFFDTRVHLNSLYWRRGDETREFWTLDDIEGKRMPDVPLFILTSNYTFSGAEEFSYNMLTRERAVIVGEVTGGGANPGGTFPINEYFHIFIPTGKAINPVTGTNWEGVGVKPHVIVDADNALKTAIKLAKESAEEYKRNDINTKTTAIDEFKDNLDKAEQLCNLEKFEEAQYLVKKAFENKQVSDLFVEERINMIGYGYLQDQKIDMAIAIFNFNSERYPESYNVYDSLGEAYMTKEMNKLAIINYKKSVELNPENQNGIDMLKKLGVAK